MRRRDLVRAAGFAAIGRSLSGNSAVGSVVVGEMLETVEDGLSASMERGSSWLS